jgi:hypothetical protein
MPIVLIAVDGINKNLREFEDMHNNVFDILIESSDPQSKAIGDKLSEHLVFVKRISNYLLDDIVDDGEEEMAYNMGAVLSSIRSLNVQRGMIITSKKVINSWDPHTNMNEWDAISM